MRQVIHIMNASGLPVPLVDEAGRLVGAVGMRDVLGAILRRHEQPA